MKCNYIFKKLNIFPCVRIIFLLIMTNYYLIILQLFYAINTQLTWDDKLHWIWWMMVVSWQCIFLLLFHQLPFSTSPDQGKWTRQIVAIEGSAAGRSSELHCVWYYSYAGNLVSLLNFVECTAQLWSTQRCSCTSITKLMTKLLKYSVRKDMIIFFKIDF